MGYNHLGEPITWSKQQVGFDLQQCIIVWLGHLALKRRAVAGWPHSEPQIPLFACLSVWCSLSQNKGTLGIE